MQLDMRMSDDLSRLAFEVSERPLGEILSPNLMWQCSCYAGDGGRSPECGPCAVHELPDAAEISDLFGRHTRIWYRGLSVLWDGWRGWPPSIDTFCLVRALLRAQWPVRDVRRLWDIGAGTGFIGLQLADAAPSITHLTAVETSMPAAEMCWDNLDSYDGRSDLTMEIACQPAQGLLTKQLQEGDAIAACPPYLPRPPWDCDSADSGPAMGTDMLRFLIRIAAEKGAPLALGYSTLAQSDVNEALANASGLRMEVLAERSVPLRLALSPEFFEWLMDERGLRQETDDVFAYHHTIRAVIFTPQG